MGEMGRLEATLEGNLKFYSLVLEENMSLKQIFDEHIALN